MPPPKTKKEQEPEQDLRLAFKVDGVRYDLDLANIPNRIQMDAARLTGMPWSQVMNMAGVAFSSGFGDQWIIATMMYVARRCVGENPQFDTILDSVTTKSEFEVVDDEESNPEV